MYLRNPATLTFQKHSNRNSSARRKVGEKLFCPHESLEGEKRPGTVPEFRERPGTEKPGNLEKKRRRTPNIRRVQLVSRESEEEEEAPTEDHDLTAPAKKVCSF